MQRRDTNEYIDETCQLKGEVHIAGLKRGNVGRVQEVGDMISFEIGFSNLS